MTSTDGNSKRPKAGSRILRWLAILSLTGLFSILVTPLGVSAATTYTLTVAPSTQTISTAQKAEISFTLTNSGADPVASKTIYYTITNSDSGIPTLTGTVNTDGSGVANIVYPRLYSASGTTDTITSWADVDNSGSTQADPDPTGNSVTVHWGTFNVDITSAPTRAVINNNASVVATVTDQDSNPVEGANVRFLVTGANPTSGVATTDSNGEATFTYSGDTVGTDTVRAFVDLNANTAYNSGEPTDTTTIQWIDITFTLSPSSQGAILGDQATIDATVTGASGSIDNLRIRYKVTGANPKTGTVYTDASGDATISYTGTHSGTDTVTAYIDLNTSNVQDSGEPSDTATIDWSTASLNLTPSSQTVTTNTSASLTASLSNTNVSVEGVVIRYSVTGANSTSGTATTDSNGNATISYTGTNAGTDTVTAYADYNNNGSQDGGEPSVTASVTWTLTASLSLSPTTTTPGVGSTSYTAVALTTSSGGVPGVPTRYSVSGANSASGTMTTDGNGNTVISYNGTNSGADTLTAYADMNNNGSQDTGEPTASVTITWGGSASGGGTTPPPTSFAPAQPTTQKSGCMYFPATQHNLCAGFEAY